MKKFLFICFLLTLIFGAFSFTKGQNQIPMCSAPQNLLIWPGMSTNVIPVASSTLGALTNSPIRFLPQHPQNSNVSTVSIFNTLHIYGRSGSNNWFDNSENSLAWVIIDRGPLETRGPRINHHSGGAVVFRDISTSSDRNYHTLFSIAQSPYLIRTESGIAQVNTTSYGHLYFNYGEHNISNSTITSPRLGIIPPGDARYKGGIMTLTWDGKLGIGTTSPQAKLHVNGTILLGNENLNGGDYTIGLGKWSAIYAGSDSWWADEFYLTHNAYWNNAWRYRTSDSDAGALVANFGGGRIAFWTAPGGSANATITNMNLGFYQDRSGNIGIGTTSPQAKLHVIGDILSSATITAQGFCIGNNCINSWQTGGGLSGGQQNYLTKWTSATSVGNSIIFDNGTNVGIGTNNPQSKLHVVGITQFQNNGANIRIIGDNHVYQEFYPRGISNGRFGWIGYGYVNTNNLTIMNENSTGTLSLGTNGTSRLTINSNGNIGIGTNNPAEKLEVKSDGNTRISLDSGANNWAEILIKRNNRSKWSIGNLYGGNYHDLFYIYNYNLSSYALSISSNTNNVGIGTITPGEKLHVIGNILSSANSPYIIINRNNSNLESGIKFQSNNNTAWEIELAGGTYNNLVIAASSNEPVILLDNSRKVHIGAYTTGQGKFNVYGGSTFYSSDGSRLLLEISEE